MDPRKWTRKLAGAALIAMLTLSMGPQLADACSRILWHNSLGTYVGRGEDWFADAPTDLWVLPRGQERSGAVTEGRINGRASTAASWS